ncbi:aldehyde dehydrogenase [Rugamonas apoptosis]|uniref:Aldehyde dehydrogenase n=1 Tax=Rugamonas apoptosis TaxID=2758570 RepID=A0A7W2ILS8_9BURK|nr:aldehyde dehydrogenase [Rugamonas apoptosis]MBA5689130.1 aldehyde dehydrogenase [Rugamonas apoptosis]
MNKIELLIGGESRAASNGATFERKNPLSGEVVTLAAAATPEDADAAVAAAAAAFPAWSAMAPSARRLLLLKAAEVMDRRAPEFVAIGVAEAASTPVWYGFNAMLAANMLRDAAGLVTQLAGEVIPSDIDGNLALAVRQPAGVVLGIAPWNAPVILGTRAIAVPLACGNTVVLKASELTPGLHRLIGEVFQEAGFPAGVVNVLSNAPADAPALVERLIANPAVKRVNFTGSTHVGRIIGQLAAKYLKPAVLELGGKNPMLVLDDADLDEAVTAAAFGSFFNQGQICMSTDRIIVARAVADAFVDKLATKVASMKAGKPGSDGCILGAMVSPEAAARVERLVADAVAKGATLATGPVQADGALLQPVLVDGLTPAMDLYREEAFGPVVSVLRVDSDEEALALANDSEYGLSASVFSKDIGRALALAKRIESGICHINSSTVHDEAQMPFGGVKSSGYGRFGGKAGMAEFTDLRWITVQTTHRHYPV